MKNTCNSPIFKSLALLSKKEREAILQEQCILEYYQTHIEKTVTKEVRALKLRNVILLEFAEKVSSFLDSIDVTHAFIKGIVLIEDLYPSLGDRFLSDIDVLIDEDDFEFAMSKLQGFHGFTAIRRGSWEGNNFKAELDFKLAYGRDFYVTLEIHRKLMWHTEAPFDYKIEKSKKAQSKLYTLDPTHHFFYLVYHYAFQHNCQKLYWLTDISLFYEAHNEEINWEEFERLVHRFQMTRCAGFVKKLSLKAFNISLDKVSFSTWLPFSRGFLLSDNQRGFYYLILKLFLKDRFFRDSVRYLGLWLRN